MSFGWGAELTRIAILANVAMKNKQIAIKNKQIAEQQELHKKQMIEADYQNKLDLLSKMHTELGINMQTVVELTESYMSIDDAWKTRGQYSSVKKRNEVFNTALDSLENVYIFIGSSRVTLLDKYHKQLNNIKNMAISKERIKSDLLNRGFREDDI